MVHVEKCNLVALFLVLKSWYFYNKFVKTTCCKIKCYCACMYMYFTCTNDVIGSLTKLTIE